MRRQNNRETILCRQNKRNTSCEEKIKEKLRGEDKIKEKLLCVDQIKEILRCEDIIREKLCCEEKYKRINFGKTRKDRDKKIISTYIIVTTNAKIIKTPEVIPKVKEKRNLFFPLHFFFFFLQN